MDKHLMHAPFFWFWLELPHLARDVFESCHQHVKAAAVEFDFFISFFTLHNSSYFIGSHNSTLFPSGSINQPNKPNSSFSILPTTCAPPSLTCLSASSRLSTI